MAGTFTHWMVVEKALDKFNRLPSKHKYFSNLLMNNHFVMLGSVGPDYPYLSELKNNILKLHSWADRMHYENTGGFVIEGIKNLQNLKDKEEFKVCLPWLCGYVTHLIADTVIHPVVNAIVGPYIFNSTEHRHCEMIQDSFIFKEIKKVEISYADYTRLIKMCSEDDTGNINPALDSFWTKTLEMSHPDGKDKFRYINPDDWHKGFLSKIELASTPIPIFRHIGEEANLAYKMTGSITDYEKNTYLTNTSFPGGRRGDFIDAFEMAVNEVVKTWDKLFKDIEENQQSNCTEYIRNWNLDTGVDEEKLYFW
ncbi:MAG TPA: hypothetical protein DDW94_12565 [Deltaproteobacteria bacterium]|nr:MAG: hypothetical protein A2Z79_08710 [Deltaproteobacteria bacterium GWA2_55_82]OGQ64535.1 MAG: hypothetical protein A3I81_07700 [Deltaproteobacteria bacterium RIFCSPLOWO2_02_FULL_55_12]OIJ73661.1 MAG: hypothetical protein A2V21_304905 [Deltaproteobacteria bacterium GWC2_55_46]HBG47803.1 hypothetical protein [Deltaproteobacteria bacterium]HCY11975.1 hypothetical protein [Deltaproteobacteria bacterium]